MSKLLPATAQTYSKAPSRYPAGTPEHAVAASGAWAMLSDGNRYLDCTNGLGAVILGHGDEMGNVRVANALPLPSAREETCARTLLACLTWPGAESVRFGKNGADVTGAAVRLARAVTGRDMLAYSGYHGHHDWSMGEPPMNAGIPEAVRDLSVRVPWPDIEALRGLLTTRAFACYVSEPWPTALHDSPPPDGYWQEVRRICDATGTLLVCDEMVSGFRMAVGGGAEVYGISPDIGCYGKAMGNGYAVSAIVTRWELAQRWERDVFFSTTHGAEQAGIAAATACMAIVRDEDVPRALAGLGSEIMQLPGVSGYPQRPALSGWTPEALSCLVREHRVLTQGYVNISLAMCEDTKARSLLLRALEATAPKREAAA